MPKLTALSLSLLVASSSAFAPPAASFCSSTKALSAATFTGPTQPRALQARSALVQRRAARLSMATAQAEATKSAMTADGHTIGVVGATGAVGEEIVSVLHRRGFPVKELKLFSSARSAGKVGSFSASCYAVLAFELQSQSFVCRSTGCSCFMLVCCTCLHRSSLHLLETSLSKSSVLMRHAHVTMSSLLWMVTLLRSML
jgi:Semialdehyde dehydrogenase, NAD binding domain